MLIDEIQYVDQFEDLLNSLKNSGCDVYVTGSNSRMLSGEISSALRGRSMEIRVYPLSFSEYYSAVGGDKKSAWNMYLRYGGFPFVAQEQDLKLKAEYLKLLESTVATRDIVERYRLRNPDLFEAVYDFLCSNIGSPVSAKKISDTLRSNGRLSITPDTVGEYLTYLTESFLFYRTYRYDVKGKGYLKTLGKYYSVDIGLRNAHLQYRQTEITHAIENIVYLELVRRGYHVDTGKNENKEIDFVARSEKDIYYIQVAYSIVETEKMEQEIGSFRGLDDGYKKIVITMDDDPFEVLPYGYRKIEMMSFLLNPNALEEI